MDVVIAEAIGLLVALLVAGFSSGAREALSILERRERLNGTTDADEDTIFGWWRQRQRPVLMVLRVFHRLGLITMASLGALIALEVLSGAPSIAVVIVGLTLVAVFFADVVPIAMAHRRPQIVARWALHILRLPYLLLYPITRLLLLWRRVVRGKGNDDQTEDRLEAASALKAMFSGERLHTEERQELMRSVTALPGTVVREVMVPRTDMVSLSHDMSLEEILPALLECGHSRIPVYRDTLDEIVGLFYAKDIIGLMSSGDEFQIDELLRQPYFVPETKPIDELLGEFQKKRIHMAIVVDEFGGTAGLITLEDVIEEFFGDIQDEYDVEPSQIVELSDGAVLADARIDLDEIAQHFDVHFPQTSDYDSLGGFLLAHTGSVPQPGEQVQWEHLLFRIVEADAKRIDSVEIVIVPPSSEEPKAAIP